MIGRVEGIFSTYASHDISHVEAMLSMLDWLIPPETKDRLTPVEWLLAVLSFYLHDLGMVVTSEEFEKRQENPVFCDFLEKLEQDPESRDYLDRLEKIPEDKRDEFIYQEFVREHHAQRIREWVTGEHSTNWGEKISPVADEILDILSDLPERFRTNLADICESHHRENLEDRGYFPLSQRHGQSMANIQYVAILLRAADLLHITKDRTPSIMFRTLKISDPMGIDEWKKQMGVSSVAMKTREFRPNDAASHVIVISADFEEERPFFVLTEYITYANQQIEQTKHWADKSQKDPDAQHYSFPWHRVEGDIRVEGNEPLPMRFELDRGRLLDLLVGHTIYNDPTVAVRELLQNAIDAVRYQHYLGEKLCVSGEPAPPMGEVHVRWNAADRELVVQDDGIGMDLHVIENNLMKVGASFYDTPTFRASSADFIPISRFGIGILTCFMVSDNIEIVTCQKGEGHRIRMSSVQADYLLKSLSKGDPALADLNDHGTKVTLRLRPSVDLTKRTVLDIVRHWIVLPACDVIYEDGEIPSQKIGFTSVTDALRHQLFEADGESKSILSSENIDIESKKFTADGQIYELAFAVRRGFTPERGFAGGVPEGAPGTCLEGIRVDATLPCFGKIAALLSVRNNKAFRTTVSRDRLEQDEEYIRVGLICADMLFEHVIDEAKRIQNSEGKPVSQASTATRWLFSSLSGRTNIREIRDSLNRQYSAFPHLVVEGYESDLPDSQPTKRLLSIDQMSKLESFWSIEARVVDYLGIISRDLGRELSLNEFLSSVAPDFYDRSMSPTISDIRHFRRYVLATHIPEVAEFSRRNQQTIVKWVQRTGPVQIVEIDKREVEIIQPKWGEMIGTDYQPSRFDLPDRRNIHGVPGIEGFQSMFKNIFEDVFEAQLTGDVSGIYGVRTRLAVILAPDSEIARLWRGLFQAINELQGTANFRERALVLVAAYILRSRMKESASRLEYYPDRAGSPIWRELVVEIQNSGVLQRFDLSLPPDILRFGANTNEWFDATTYWLDWDKASS